MADNGEKQPLEKQPEDGGTPQTEEQKAAAAGNGEPAPIDYKAEAEALKTQLAEKEVALAKAEGTIVDDKRKKKEGGSVYQEMDEQELDKRIEQRASAIVHQTLAETTSEIVDELLEAIADPSERELTKLHLENSVQRTGYTRKAIRQDIENARAIANKKRVVAENVELKDAIIARNTAGKGTGGNNQDPLPVPGADTASKLNPAEEALLARRGLTAKDVKQGSAVHYPEK